MSNLPLASVQCLSKLGLNSGSPDACDDQVQQISRDCVVYHPVNFRANLRSLLSDQLQS